MRICATSTIGRRPEVVADVRAVLAGLRPDRIADRHYTAANRAFRLIPGGEG